MPALFAVLMLTLGTLLSAFGTLGFLGNWASGPDHDSLRYVQTLATTGRRASGAGIALRVLAAGFPAGLWLTLAITAALLAVGTYLTATTNTIIPTN